MDFGLAAVHVPLTAPIDAGAALALCRGRHHKVMRALGLGMVLHLGAGMIVPTRTAVLPFAVLAARMSGLAVVA